MKRIFLGLVMCFGMLAMGVTNASAARYCNVDPTVGVGLPVRYSIDVKTNAAGTSTHLYASGTYRTTTFGGVVGLP